MTSEQDPLVGRTLADRYRVDALLARGGMARVYRARDDRLARDVAVKVLSRPYADDPAFTARFLAEARSAAGITHPNLVHVYDSGSDGAEHFIVMELLRDHRSLRQVLDEGGPLPVVDVVEVGQQLLAGLAAVHDRGLVHCDVKAGNVMLAGASVKLIDLGIARTPHDGERSQTSLGSLGYMAPELLRGASLTASSDLFGLGVVLYEALTGRLPYAGTTPEAIAAAHDAGEVRPPSTLVPGVPGRLDGAILQALRRDPAVRFDSAVAMSRALASSLEDRDAQETQVIRTGGRSDDGGYVPPILPPPSYEPSVDPRRARRSGAPQRPPAGTARATLGLIGTGLLLAAAVLVVIVVVVPLLQRGATPGGSSAPSASAAPATTQPAGATVLVPNTIGMSKDQAIDAANAAGLDWTIRCTHDEARPEGIIDQEPRPDVEVRRGSRFTMYSARVEDCE